MLQACLHFSFSFSWSLKVVLLVRNVPTDFTVFFAARVPTRQFNADFSRCLDSELCLYSSPVRHFRAAGSCAGLSPNFFLLRSPVPIRIDEITLPRTSFPFSLAVLPVVARERNTKPLIYELGVFLNEG